MLDEYQRRHAEVWPELEALLRKAGVRTYTIFAWGEILFSYMEVEDYGQMVRRVTPHEVAQRWEQSLEDVLEYPELDEATGWPPMLDEIWTMRQA
jgi:L-rhamnose mutarotase